MIPNAYEEDIDGSYRETMYHMWNQNEISINTHFAGDTVACAENPKNAQCNEEGSEDKKVVMLWKQ